MNLTFTLRPDPGEGPQYYSGVSLHTPVLPSASSYLQLENASKKRERATSDLRTIEQKQEKKRLKSSKKAKDPDPPGKDFSPYDYSKSDFGAFAGKDREDTPRRRMIV